MKQLALTLTVLVMASAAQAEQQTTLVNTIKDPNDRTYCKVFYKDNANTTRRAPECFETNLCISSNAKNGTYPQEQFEQLVKTQYDVTLTAEELEKCPTTDEVLDNKLGHELTESEAETTKDYEAKVPVGAEKFYVLNKDGLIKQALKK